jgi:uncharacterized protein (DUF58 family)
VVRTPAALWASAVALGAIAGGAVSPALRAVGIALLLLTGAAWAALAYSVRRLRVDRRISDDEVNEEASLRLHFTMDGPGWLPIRVEVEDHAGGWRVLERRGDTVELRLGRPGSYVLGPSRLRLRDPVGIFERQMVAGRPHRLLVLPTPAPGEWRHHALSGHIDEAEPQGLAPYVPGMPVSRIHWPTLAKGAELQVRHLAAPPTRLPLVAVDATGAPTGEALDWVARTAAGQILALARRGGCRVLLPGDVSPVSVVGLGGAWRAVHRRLATLGRSAAAERPASSPPTAEICIRAVDAPVALPPGSRLPDGVRAAS